MNTGIYEYNEQTNTITRTKQNKTDTGAGIIMLEEYKGKLAIILFHNKYKYTFEDPGGQRDNMEDLKDTASRELTEESANTFRIDKNMLKDNNAVRHYEYVGYFVYVRGPLNNNDYQIHSEIYNKNRRMISKNKAPDVWRETDTMTRIYVNELLKPNILTAKGKVNVTDVYGNKIIMSSRPKALVRKAIQVGLFNDNTTKLSVITLKKNDKCENKQKPFLNGTKCYYI